MGLIASANSESMMLGNFILLYHISKQTANQNVQWNATKRQISHATCVCFP